MTRDPLPPTPPNRIPRAAGVAALVAGSVALHALVIGGVAGGWPGGSGPGAGPARPDAPVQVVMVRPPPAAAVPAPASVPAAPVKPAAAKPPAIRKTARPAPPAGGLRAAASSEQADAARAVIVAAAPVEASDFDPSATTAASDPVASPTPGGPAAQGEEGRSAGAGATPAEPPAASASDTTTAEPSASLVPVPRADDPPRPPLPALPASRKQNFKVYWGDFTEERSVARLQYRLVQDGERYEIRTEAEAEGLISLVYSGTLVQVSTGRLGPGGLEPLRYAEQRGKRAERAVAFDPDAHRLLPAGGAPAVDAPPGTQDRLSVFYQIGLVARSDPAAFAPGSVRQLPVASLKDVENQRFEVIGDAMLMAPGGPIRTLHLRRPTPPGRDDPRIDLWLGYDFDMLPVRLRIEDAGRRVLDQVIERDG